MPEGDGSTEATATTQRGGTASHLPWHLIPSFDPGETNLQEYSRRLEFLAGLWPTEHLGQLAPRAALMCKGSAFHKVTRIPPEKLKTNSADGVKLIVQTLGGVWGKTELEDRYEKFEKAIFGVIQKQDESNESYLARHEILFEELITDGTKLEDVQAYLLLRNSALSAEDKKRVLVESKGALKYSTVTSSIRMLGARFFHEVQGQQKQYKSKTYEVNHVQETFPEEESTLYGEEASTFHVQDAGDVPELVFEHFLNEGDEDALVMQQFEDCLIDTLQGDSEMSTYMTSYVDARRRLTEKSKFRGFWPVKPSKGVGKKGGKFKGRPFKPRRSLAQRIAESECKICHQIGHWKAECPQRQTQPSAGSNPKTQTANVLISASDLSEDEADVFLVEPNHEIETLNDCQAGPRQCEPKCAEAYMCMSGEHRGKIQSQYSQDIRRNAVYTRMKDRMTEIFQSCPMPFRNAPSETRASVNPSHVPKNRSQTYVIRTQLPTGGQTACDVENPKIKTYRVSEQAQTFFATTQAVGILDLGASQTVMGEHQLPEFLQSLPDHVQSQVFEKDINMSFRFGNNSVVPCHRAVFIPVDKFWIRIAIVPSKTPFLISNNVCRSLGAIIDTEMQTIFFRKLGCTIPMKLSCKKLFLIDFCELLAQKPPSTTQPNKIPAENVLTCHDNDSPGLIPEKSSGNSGKPNQVTSDTAISRAEPSSCDRSKTSCLTKTSEVATSSHVSARPCRSICGPEDPRGCGSPEGAARKDEFGPAAPTHSEVRPSQARPTVLSSAQGRSPICGVVPSQVQDQQQASPPRVHLRDRMLDRPPRACSRSESCNHIDNQHDPIQGSQQSQSQEPSQHEGNGRSHRPGQRGGCAGSLAVALRASRSESSPERNQSGSREETGAIGGCHARGGPTASHPDSGPTEVRGNIHVADPACSQLIEQCIHEINSFLESPLMSTNIPENSSQNWIRVEMMQYMIQHKTKTQYPKIDLLEVYCSSDNQLTNQGNNMQFRSMRFGLREGDLSTYEGRCRLYMMF